MKDALCYISATEAIEKFKSGELSPVDLMRAVIDRASDVESKVKSLSHTFFDEAMTLAREAEQRYSNDTARPLEGIPLGVKDSIEHEGKPYTWGSLLLQDNLGTKTEPWLQRLLDAGAIVHARTTTPEFLFNATTYTKAYGVTRNPWNLACSVGASSGGSGATLAAGTSTLALGTDAGGSIRLPASQNGIVGFKPPFGRVPVAFPEKFDSIFMNGPMARTVADTILLQNIIAGQHPDDIHSVYPKFELPTEYPGIGGMRIGYSMDFGYREVDADIRANTLQALDRLRDLGAIVEEVDLGWSTEVDRAVEIGSAETTLPALKYRFRMWGIDPDAEDLMPYIKALFAVDVEVTGEQYVQRIQIESNMYQDMSRVFSDYEAFIAPTTTVASLPADWNPSQPILLNGREVETGARTAVLTSYFNLLGHLPVLNMPSGHDRNGVPTGIQIAGPAYHDHIPFRVAAAYETRYQNFTGDRFPAL